MYYGRKKGIIIAIVVVVVVILLAIAGILTVMYTDLFKSDKTLFWKYMSIGLGDKATQSAQLEDVEKLKVQSPYTVKSELTATSTNEELNNTLEKIKISVQSETDKVNNYSHTNTKIGYANATIFNLDYANTDDIYALKSDEIVTVYLGVRNENLKVLFQKLGVTDTSSIPDTITPINYAELLKISEEEKEHIKQTYTDIIINSISEDSYSKQTEAVIEKDGVSYNTTSYRLDLTGIQISDILVNILNTLKTDSITLNLITTKAKTIGLTEEYTTVDGINDIIDSMITELQETEFTDTSFVVYSYKGQNIATEILIKNTQKYTIYNGEQNTKIVAEDLTSTEEYSTVSMDIMYQATSTESNISIKVAVDEEEVIALDIVNTGSATQGSLETVASLSITSEGESIDLAYNQTLEFVNELENIEKLDETNCAILNDYTQEQLATLLQAVVNQINVVYTQKAQMLGIMPASNQVVQQSVTQ